MSWGATAYTPIIAYNEPPFGFAETITPPDFKTNNADPWSSTEELKADLNARFAQLEKARSAERFEPIETEQPVIQQRYAMVFAATVVFYYLLRGKGDMLSPVSVLFQAVYWFAVFLFLRR